MMYDIKKRSNFARLVNYANNPKKARLIDSKDVRLDSIATIVTSMQRQADDKPGRKLANPVYHISLNFVIEDMIRLSDGLMTEIARKYMQRMRIVNAQYIVCRHSDTSICILSPSASLTTRTPSVIAMTADAVRESAAN